MTAMTCDHLRGIAPELALGLLTGHERARAIEHLDTCHGCRVEVASLAETADELLLLAPEVEPPPGFEGGVLTRLGHDQPLPSTPAVHHHHGRPWLAVAAVAAAVVVVLAAVAALRLNPASDGDQVAAAPMADMRTGTGVLVGQARLEGDPPYLVLDIPGWVDLMRRYGAAPGADYRVAVELADGSRDLAPLPARTDERWEIPLDASPGEVASVAIIDDRGRTWCTARFG